MSVLVVTPSPESRWGGPFTIDSKKSDVSGPGVQESGKTRRGRETEDMGTVSTEEVL